MSDQVVVREEMAVVPAASATTLLTAIASAASNPAADIDKMERLFAMHQTMVKAEAEAAFNAALARVQAKIIPVVHNARNEQTNSKYAKLAEINKAISPIYSAEGFSISFDNGDSPTQGYIRVIAILSHQQGHSRQYHIDMPPDETGAKGTVNKTRVHATGSTNAYARRYLVLMIFNVSTEDDTDGVGKKNQMPDNARLDFLAAIEDCADEAAAAKLWQAIATATTAAGDVAAHDELRSAMAARRKALKQPAKVI